MLSARLSRAAETAELAEFVQEEGAEFVEEEGDASRRLTRYGADRIEGEADKAAHKAEAGAQPIGRDREIDCHRPPLQIAEGKIAAGESAAEARIVEPGGVRWRAPSRARAPGG